MSVAVNSMVDLFSEDVGVYMAACYVGSEEAVAVGEVSLCLYFFL